MVLGKKSESTKREGLLQAAEAAVPEQSGFHFEDIDG